MKPALSSGHRALRGLVLVTAVASLVGCGPRLAPLPTKAPTAKGMSPTGTPSPQTPAPTIGSPAPTVTLQPVSTASSGPPAQVATYVVEKGDVLSAIALDHGVTVQAIVAANGLTSDLIYPGQVLTIPLQTADLPPTPGPTATPVVSATLGPGPAPTLPPVEPALITHGDRSLPYVALTFDACQKPEKPAGYDAQIIDTLTATNTPATLFLGGLWMTSHPTQTEKLAAEPLFELGNHSWSHPDFRELDSEAMGLELVRTQDIMYALTGQRPTLFRLPFGTYDDEVLKVIARHGLRTIQWDVVTGDPDPNISAEDIVSAVSSQAQNGSIVIMHMNTRGWHTAEALPTIIEGLRAHGYRLVTVSQILGLEPVPTPEQGG